MKTGGNSVTQNRHGSRRVRIKKEKESLLDILDDVVRDRATAIAAQIVEDMASDWHLDDGNKGNEEHEEIRIEDIPSLMSVNQTTHSTNQLGHRRKKKLQVDIVPGFSDIAKKMCTSFQVEANVCVTKLSDSLLVVDNYPKYLAMELKRLGFSTNDNLSISKSMRMDPSNVEFSLSDPVRTPNRKNAPKEPRKLYWEEFIHCITRITLSIKKLSVMYDRIVPSLLVGHLVRISNFGNALNEPKKLY
ncbi:hypothetical protein FNV43_RR15062 [Rhamnella rubrinervis]|uniref:Uncharacterized protein n=1 Tax=Rhamnella rubrinervis TaxID=2594499 RepID=A0A8K0E6L2_9ROSA|nr:hypothetical protein FNV43_RR15062 [Rhamnella rubrinervis]